MKPIDNRMKSVSAKLYFLVFIWLLWGGAAYAVNTAAARVQTQALELSKDALQAKIEAINARQDFDENTKTTVLKYYHSVQDNLVNIDTYKAKTAEFKLAVKLAPDAIKQLQKAFEQTQQKQAKLKPEDFSGIVTEELEQRLIIEKEKASNLDEQRKKLENELALQNSRPQLIRQETVSAQQDLENSQKKLETPLTTELKVAAEAELL